MTPEEFITVPVASHSSTSDLTATGSEHQSLGGVSPLQQQLELMQPDEMAEQVPEVPMDTQPFVEDALIQQQSIFPEQEQPLFQEQPQQILLQQDEQPAQQQQELQQGDVAAGQGTMEDCTAQYQCGYCQALFADFNLVQEHMMTAHAVSMPADDTVQIAVQAVDKEPDPWSGIQMLPQSVITLPMQTTSFLLLSPSLQKGFLVNILYIAGWCVMTVSFVELQLHFETEHFNDTTVGTGCGSRAAAAVHGLYV